jgi:SAM-dependent methyltransferase
MIRFLCNVCSRENLAESLTRETPRCVGCGSNVRIRSMIRILSVELFQEEIPLIEFPVLPQVKGLGLSDDPRYAAFLEAKFSYVNTYYDREPFLDITKPHPEMYGTYDFILSSEVFEHTAPPIEQVFRECWQLLKPNGFLCATVPFVPEGETREHYPDLYEYSTLNLGGRPVLVNRKRDGTVEVHENPGFHGGAGATLEMREFSRNGLSGRLLNSGFRTVAFDSGSSPRFGIYPEGDYSLPFVARKERFVLMDGDQPIPDALLRQKQIAELRSKLAELEIKLRGVAESRWVKLGNILGVGPRLR